MNKILIVDDEPSIIEVLTLVLTDAKYKIDACLSGYDAIEKVKSNNYDLVLLDIKMPGMDGLEVLEKILSIDEGLAVIMISGHGTFETAVEATKRGAYNYIQKPPDYDELKLSIKNALNYKKSQDELRSLKQDLLESNKLIGKSEAMQNIRQLIPKYAGLDLNVLITGESGTGKMLVCRQIHLNSSRADHPLVVINCANLVDSKIDEELFGVFEEGKVKIKGKLIEAYGGSVLFDEVSNLSIEAQSKILKVIEEGKFSRPGQEGEIRLDVRFLFSTNRDLSEIISDGNFRDDLYHRINVLSINIPPLRDRIGDIEELINHFSGQISSAYNLKKKELTDKARERLKVFRLPGNVRELRNLLERLMFTVDNPVIDEDDIAIPDSRHSKILTDLMNKNMTLNDFQNESEKLFLLKMLNDYKYNIVQTAEALKIQRSHLYKLLTKYNIPTPSKIK
ncbi:sigma-54-dependent Fis family transcriptional regulator [bacterium]|nr:MAG: sigma-54-dependent Fis family transcriptional regulator [bacterium]